MFSRRCAELDSVRVAVIVTTDKVYRNAKSVVPHSEDDALGGLDPYSASKAASELAIESLSRVVFVGAGDRSGKRARRKRDRRR